MPQKITYKEAGVDVKLADDVLSSLGDTMRATFRSEVMGKMGGFAALFRPGWSNYQDPVSGISHRRSWNQTENRFLNRNA